MAADDFNLRGSRALIPSLTLGPKVARALLVALPVAVMFIDLYLAGGRFQRTWWRLLPPGLATLAIGVSVPGASAILGFERVARRPGLLLGAVAGILAYGLLVAWVTSGSWYGGVNCRLRPASCLEPDQMRYVIRNLTVFSPVVEELAYRTVGFGPLAAAMDPRLAVLISVAGFSALHVMYGSFDGLQAIGGLGFCALFWFGRSLALNIAVHAACNWTVLLTSVVRWALFYRF
ncbi:MAG: CPBP family intramembrane glutamic endopeptidase [Gemmatimonadales bacterium]